MKYSKITISGRSCTGKTVLFTALQEKLAWPAFSAGHFFREYAKKHGVSLQKAEEQTPVVTKDVDYGMRERLETEPHLILEGWMTGIMAAKIPGVLKVLLVCDDTERTRRYAQREGISMFRAKKFIAEREKNLFAKYLAIHGRDDVVDPKNYDLVVDTTTRTAQETLTAVLNKLNT